MLMSFRKISTLARIEPAPVATAVATKFTVDAVCNPAGTGIGVAPTLPGGGEPMTLATFTVIGADVLVCELVSVTRAVSTCCPSCAAVGIQENVYCVAPTPVV